MAAAAAFLGAPVDLVWVVAECGVHAHDKKGQQGQCGRHP